MTGESFTDGVYTPGESYAPDDLKRVKDTALDFLKTLRRLNPGAYILWCYGMLGISLEESLKDVIAGYRAESGDERVEYLALPDTTPETIGCRMHPGLNAHRAAAEVIVKKIRELGL